MTLLRVLAFHRAPTRGYQSSLATDISFLSNQPFLPQLARKFLEHLLAPTLSINLYLSLEQGQRRCSRFYKQFVGGVTFRALTGAAGRNGRKLCP